MYATVRQLGIVGKGNWRGSYIHLEQIKLFYFQSLLLFGKYSPAHGSLACVSLVPFPKRKKINTGIFCSKNSYSVKSHKFLLFSLDETSNPLGTDSSTSTMHVKGSCRGGDSSQQNPVQQDVLWCLRETAEKAGEREGHSAIRGVLGGYQMSLPGESWTT